MKKEKIFSIIIMCIIAVGFITAGIIFGEDLKYEISEEEAGNGSDSGENEEEDELNKYTVISEKGFRVLEEISMIYDYQGTEQNLIVPETFNNGKVSVTSIRANAFKNNKKLISVMLPSTILSIFENAFEGCENLSLINLENITTLSAEAFKNCKSLTNISAPKLEKISEGAFEGCSNLKTINMSNCQVIEKRGFANCTSLKNLNLLNVTKIGNEAFSDCLVLESFVSETSLRLIGAGAFKNCKMLSKVLFGSVENIDDETFSGCENLTSVTLNSANTIGKKAFNGCLSLENISLPSVYSIGEGAFSECIELKNVSIPKIKNIGGSVFSNCFSLEKLNSNKKGEFNLTTLVSIGNYFAFKNCLKLETLFIPNIIKLGYDSFAGCTALSLVKMPETIKSEDETESYCYASSNYFPLISRLKFYFEDVEKPYKVGIDFDSQETIKTIQYIVYKEVDGVISSEIVGYDLNEDQIAEIGSHVTVEFEFNPSKNEIVSVKSNTEKEIVIPNYINKRQVLTIKKGAFNAIKNSLVSVRGDSIKSIPNSLFADFSFVDTNSGEVYGLTSVSFASLETVGNQVFENCKALINVYLPKMNNVSHGSFANCEKLSEISFPEALVVSSFAFKNCVSLKTAYLPKVKTLEFSAFINAENLVSINIRDISSIKDKAFFGCVNLSKVNSKYEGECDLSKIEKVEGKNIFFGNSKLTNIKLNSVKLVSDFAFFGIGTRNAKGEIENFSINFIEVSFDVVNSVSRFFEDFTNLGCFVYNNGKRVTVQGEYGSFTLPNDEEEPEVEEQKPVIVNYLDFVFDKASGTIIEYKGNSKNVEIPLTIDGVSVRIIGKNAFRDNKTLISISFKSIVLIEENAFKNCSSLTTVENRILISEDKTNLQSIGHFAFEGCSSLNYYQKDFENKLNDSRKNNYTIFKKK